ncbi:MAG TPA: 3-hydroxybutyryl-CoA dehydrogenase [bacterium]|jgi:3-hydroxybutyryl-CoA dehydrogenase
MDVKKVGVVGLGTMGHGIAIVALSAGLEVIGCEIEQSFLDKGLEAVVTYFDRMVRKKRMEEADGEAAKSRMTGTLSLNDLSDCDIIIEVIIERMNLKQDLWRKLGDICKSDTIFASNTSSLSITEQATASGRPEQFVGLHFFNPAPMMKLVEIIRALQTSGDTMEAAAEFVDKIGKKGVRTVDSPGFIVNRLLVPYLNDAAMVYAQGLASAEDIDTAMKLGAGYPMGPLALIDLIGLDTAMWVGEIMYEEYKNEKFAPPPILRRMVRAGHLGKKSGKGFYDYS